MFISSLLFHQAEASSLNQPPPQLQLKNPSQKWTFPSQIRPTSTADSCWPNKALFNDVLDALQEENRTLLFCFGIPPAAACCPSFVQSLRAAAAARLHLQLWSFGQTSKSSNSAPYAGAADRGVDPTTTSLLWLCMGNLSEKGCLNDNYVQSQSERETFSRPRSLVGEVPALARTLE